MANRLPRHRGRGVLMLSHEDLHQQLGLAGDIRVAAVYDDPVDDVVRIVLIGDSLPHTEPGARPSVVSLAAVQDSDPLADDVEDVCRFLHRAYEEAARAHGWETQATSRVVWEDVPQANQETMRTAVSALLAWLNRTRS